MRWSWKIARFAGISVYIHATFLVLIAWLLLTQWEQSHSIPGVIGALLFVLSLFACVVMHEFGHALVARRYRVGTRDIVLLPIGGVSRMERIPDNPRQELWIALAGPLVSLGIAAALRFFLWAVHAPTPMSQITQLASWSAVYPFFVQLMAANVVLAIFNLLPAFPMDGGRIFRALLARRMNYVQATHIAAVVGQGLAFLFGLLGLFFNPFLLFIAFFVWIGATQESAMAQIRSVLDGIPVRQLTMTQFNPVQASGTLQDAVDLMLHGSQQDFPVVEGGSLVGILTRKDLLRGLSRSGKETPIGEVMLRKYPVVAGSELLQNALEKLESSGIRMLPVIDQGRLLGLFTPENLAEFIMVQSALNDPERRTRACTSASQASYSGELPSSGGPSAAAL